MDVDPTETRRGDYLVVSIGGELDVITAPALGDHLRRLIDAGERRVVVDLEAVSFIDSSGISALVQTRNAAVALGGSVALVSDRPGILKLFDISRLTEMFDVYPTVDAATEH